VGCAMLQVTADTTKPVKLLWRNRRAMRCKFNNPVAHAGFLYGLDDGVLVCMDAHTGQQPRWRGPRFGHGQLLISDDLLIVLSEEGQLALVEATPDAYREHGRVDALEGRTWNCPALAGGKLYVRNDREMACYDLRATPGTNLP
jgi:outer membrane protein assembly factor BamB